VKHQKTVVEVFCFTVNTHGEGLKWNRYAAPLIPEIADKPGISEEFSCVCRILKNRIVVELRPMDVLGL